MSCRGMMTEEAAKGEHFVQYCGVDAEFQCWCGWSIPEDGTPDADHRTGWGRQMRMMTYLHGDEPWSERASV